VPVLIKQENRYFDIHNTAKVKSCNIIASFKMKSVITRTIYTPYKVDYMLLNRFVRGTWSTRL